ncbi:MAG: peptide chain release factor N(5)-glutamine methyltransferase [Treponema sp.]|nr:peptide chain release factor N(5)-glutamine methyltransferase [Treponema sp.]
MTIKEASNKGLKLLKEPCDTASIDTPSLDAALLLSETFGVSREELIMRGNEDISEKDWKKFNKLIERRRSGESIAYILGRKEFRLLEFAVNSNVLVPRPDTETLVEAALSRIDKLIETGIFKTSVLDLCTGSGAIAISLKHERPHLRVSAADISKEALKLASKNSRHLLKGITLGTPVKFFESNLFDSIPQKSGGFDIIVSNPPYVPTPELKTLAPEVRREPSLALDGGKDGLKYIKKIIPDARHFLKEGGYLFLEAQGDQMQKIKLLLEKTGYSEVKIYKDLSGSERVISARLTACS